MQLTSISARSASPTAVLPTRLLIADAETFSHAFGMEDERALARNENSHRPAR